MKYNQLSKYTQGSHINFPSDFILIQHPQGRPCMPHDGRLLRVR